MRHSAVDKPSAAHRMSCGSEHDRPRSLPQSRPSGAVSQITGPSPEQTYRLWFELTKAAHFGMSRERVHLGAETVVSERPLRRR